MLATLTRTLLPLLSAGLLHFSTHAAEPAFDIIIEGGLVHPGTGAAPSKADVGVSAGRIAAIGDLSVASASRRIDATGKVVAPGFIDLHAHIEPIEEMPDAESALRQGVTTLLGGPDGTSPWPIGEKLTELDEMPLGPNVAYLVGHNTIRRKMMNLDNRAPTSAELAQMEAMVERGMKEGAFGLSTGLLYLPGSYANTDEVIALSRVAAVHGGFYTSHLRNEGSGLIEAVAEAIRIGKESGIPVVLTHHKVIGRPQWGHSVKTLAMVDAARAGGQDVQLDHYPYTASHTGIGVLIPAWARAGGDEEFKKRTEDPETRARILAEIEHLILTDRGGGDISKIQFAKVDWNRSLEGRTMRDWCADLGLEPTPRNGAELVVKAQLAGGANCIYHVMSDEDVERIMRHPQTMIASDGRLSKPGEGHPHPRSYGTFPRVLAEYVRERGVITLESAIHKMTGMPAERLGLTDRGLIREGFRADLVVFDSATIKDTATFIAPHSYPVGIDAVVVNGVLAVDSGGLTGARAGQVLRGPAASR